MKKEDSVIIIDLMVSEQGIEMKKWLRMIILKNNPISIVQNPTYREFAGFKYKTTL